MFIEVLVATYSIESRLFLNYLEYMHVYSWRAETAQSA
jgi:hypothetical protein